MIQKLSRESRLHELNYGRAGAENDRIAAKLQNVIKKMLGRWLDPLPFRKDLTPITVDQLLEGEHFIYNGRHLARGPCLASGPHRGMYCCHEASDGFVQKVLLSYLAPACQVLIEPLGREQTSASTFHITGDS